MFKKYVFYAHRDHVFGQKYSKNSNIATTKIFLCSTTAIIFNRAPLILVNNKWAPNQHTGMISEGSCDTETWSNSSGEFSFTITGINYILKYIK